MLQGGKDDKPKKKRQRGEGGKGEKGDKAGKKSKAGKSSIATGRARRTPGSGEAGEEQPRPRRPVGDGGEDLPSDELQEQDADRAFIDDEGERRGRACSLGEEEARAMPRAAMRVRQTRTCTGGLLC